MVIFLLSFPYKYNIPSVSDESGSLNILTGSTLASTGDNGKVHLWKESIDGNYVEYAEMGPT